MDRESIAFPKLDLDALAAALGRHEPAALKTYRDGDTLFRAGDTDFKFFVVKSGYVEILDPSEEPARRVRVLGPGEFTGDASQLTGGPAMVTAVARGDPEVYEVSGDTLRQILNAASALGDQILQAFIARRQLLQQGGTITGLRVVGSRYSRDTFRIRDFLARNHAPFTWLDLETDSQVRELLRRFGVTESETPVVVWRDLLMRNPSNLQLAETLGIRRPVDRILYDLVVIGAGPAGLAAAVYGASEGLTTLVLERTGPGGQASNSMRIENYLGFPTGVTGRELADRAVVQASKFGARLSVSSSAAALSFDNSYPVLRLETGEPVVARCLLISTGADYRKLDVDGCDRYEGCGVYYAATYNEAQMCRHSDVVVVGGGNAAGQACVFLSEHARTVFLVVRGDNLYKSMSSYLVQRLEQTPNIERMLSTTVQRMHGNGYLRGVDVRNLRTGEERTIQTPALFSFIGAVPRTDWLPREIETDPHGFAVTGRAVTTANGGFHGREPFLLETSRPGVFAAGDVRAGSVKRIATAVGEGSMTVRFVHEYLSRT